LSKKARVQARRKNSAGRKASEKPAKRSGGQAKRAGVLKRRSATARRATPDVPQFAPNFTVYVLPPDAVCLYSEDRKFFLHGELYCALATAIGKGGKNFAELARQLARSFPPDKIEEALKRLMERGYIVPASPSLPRAVDGYWASLGLPAGVAEQNLGDCRVRVEAIDVEGAAEFSAALRELGVEVVTRSPDLTVTLVNDYLERRLAELNRQRVSDRAPWLPRSPWWDRCSTPAEPPAGPACSIA
jgi:ribosomal protein S12 methylthiotransferase accessory factor